MMSNDLPAVLIVLANPFNCALSGTELRHLNALHGEGRVSVKMVFVATPADSVAVAEAVAQMALAMPYATVDADVYSRMASQLRVGLPSFVLAKRGRALAVVGNTEPLKALRLLEVLHSSLVPRGSSANSSVAGDDSRYWTEAGAN